MSNRFFLSVVAFSFFLTACGGSGNNSTTQIAYEATPIQEGGGDQGTTDGGQGTTVDGGQGTTDDGQVTTVDGGQGTTNEEVIDIIVEDPDPERSYSLEKEEGPTYSASQELPRRYHDSGYYDIFPGNTYYGYWTGVIPIDSVMTARAELLTPLTDNLIEDSKNRGNIEFPEFHLDNIPPGHVGAFPGTISGTYGGRFVGSYYYKGEAGHFHSDAELKIVLEKTGNSYQIGTIEGFLGNDITMAGDDFYGFIIGASFDTEKGGFEVTRGSKLTGKARFDTNLQFGTGTWTDVYEVFTKTDEGTCSNGCIEATYRKPDNFDEENNQNHKIVTRFTTGGPVPGNSGEGYIRGWVSEDGDLFSFPNDLYGEVKAKGFSKNGESGENNNLHGVFVTILEEDTVPGG